MKRLLIVTLLTFVVSTLALILMNCTVAPTTNNNAATPNSNAATPVANSNNANASSHAAIAADVTAKEKQIWDALKNKDHEAFGKMLATDMIFISSDGVSDKTGTISGVKDFAPTEVNLSDWKTVVLDEDAAIVVYTVNAKGTSGGRPLPPGALRASSAWVKRGGQWESVYHQDCLVEETPSTPTAETSKPDSNAAASNANHAGAATHDGMSASDDPVAHEKHLWDALKRKDWDTFDAGLAEEQVEVEPSGVYDKAGTLAGVKKSDFSKASTSDFKMTKLDADATLVTYMVKAPDGSGKMRDERHSTIWVKRGGKWLAIFHHGTPVMPTPVK